MEILYTEDQDVLLIMFKPEAVRHGDCTETRRIELNEYVNLEVAEDGTVYAIELDGRASEQAELDAIKLVTCDRDVAEEQTVSLPERE